MSDTTAEIKTDINCRYLADENARLTERKTTFSDASDASNWALSLSGGGIRSATFSLGVMQALARAPLNDAAESSAGANTWLKRFDYLSTVSGGGYIGALFISLFAEKKEADKSSEPTNVTATAPRAVEPLSQANAPVQKVAHPTNEKAESAPIQVEAANAAYKFLEEEPPRRVSMPLEEGAPKGVEGTRSYLARPLEWLRENGRYLTPNGAGDFGYALSLTLRNLLAAHYVIGTIALTAFLLSQLVAAYAYSRECVWPSAMCKMLAQTTLVDANPLQTFVWSPASWLAVSVLMLAVVPLIGAFWVSYPKDGESKNDPSSALNFAVRGYLYVAAVAFASFCFWRASHLSLAILGALVCVSCAVSVVWHWIALPLVSSQRCSVAEERVKLTRWLSIALISTVLLAAFALVETAAQTLYRDLSASAGTLSVTTLLAGAVMYAVRQIATWTPSKAPGSLLSRIPLNVILFAVAVFLVLLVAFFWAYVAVWLTWANEVPSHWVRWWGGEPPIHKGVRQDIWVVRCMFMAALALALLTGRFPGFINLSSYAALYGARLTRAYLGASNGARFDSNDLNAQAVSEPHKDDDLALEAYYANRYAPIHLVNVCLNQTATSNERLVQYDRKGVLLTVTPTCYLIDGTCIPHEGAAKGHSKAGSKDKLPNTAMSRLLSSDIPRKMSIGDWIGTSGAAFGTGTGRGNSLSRSLLFGLSNVRTGRWFDLSEKGPRPPTVSGAIAEAWRLLVPTQAYLFNELLGRFHGLHRQFVYLTDGGHFDNTGLHPLLKTERNVKFTVVCDNGEDALCQWEDLANLIRLARIDHGLEVEIDKLALQNDELKRLLSTPTELSTLASGETDKCAVLLQVRYPNKTQSRGHVLVIKPRVIKSAPVDVYQYKAVNSGFPQQSTVDQFFDEAQWESYRKLGIAIGEQLFGSRANGESTFAIALRKYLHDAHKEPAV